MTSTLVAEADRFFERVRRQDDRQAFPGQRANELIDLLLGADVQASGRVIENKDPRLCVQPFGQNDLLLVAAGEVEAERLDAGRPNPQPVDPVSRDAPLLLPVDQAISRQAGEIRQGDIGRDGQEENETFDAAFARDVADAEIDGVGRRLQA